MLDLVIDMSPTAINRTAIYHIALDTAEALRERTTAFRYGTDYLAEAIRDRPGLDARHGGIIGAILGDGGMVEERWTGVYPGRPRGRQGCRLLMFDPLYALLEDVGPDDVVFVLDLTPVTNPEWHEPRVCELYAIAFQRVAASGARIAAISRNTALAMWANYGVPYSAITVVPLYLRKGVGANEGEGATPSEAEKVLLFVGSLETRKNISGLLRAFEASGLCEEGYRLAIAGGNGKGADQIRADAAGLPGVELKGFVPDEELRRLYRTSAAFVYPSYLEGFGVPILEAASWGLPILTSLTGATGEVAPPGSLIVDPYDIAEVARGLRRIVAIGPDERARIAVTNREHAARYNFGRYMGVIEELVFPRREQPAEASGLGPEVAVAGTA